MKSAYSRLLRNPCAFIMGSTLLIGLQACSGSGAEAALAGLGANDVQITGSLSSSLLAVQSAHSAPVYGAASADLSTLALVCATLSVPAQTGSGSVAADGSFSVTITDAKGKKLSCYIAPQSDKEEILAALVFKDHSDKDIDGNDKKENSRTLGGKAELGNIDLDLNTGSATVDTANIQESAPVTEVAGSGAWAVTGNWEFSKVAASELPKGYKPICSVSDSDCHGPGEGMNLYVQLVSGVKNGTTTPAYGMMLWQGDDFMGGSTTSLQAYEACSGGTGVKKLGTTFANLQANGVDLSANTDGVTQGSFQWATSVNINNSSIVSQTGTQTLTDGWKIEHAMTRWPIQQGCSSVTFRGKQVWRCLDDENDGNAANDVYSFGLGGGCVLTGTTTPVFMQDWNKFKGNVGGTIQPNCSNVTPASPFQDFQGNSCAGYYDDDGFGSGNDPVQVTCSNANGFSATADGATIDNALQSQFNWNNIAQIAQGTDCSAIATNVSPDSDKLAQLKCYTDAYYAANLDNDASLCLPRIRTNWAATTSADFLAGNSDKPKAQVLANFVNFDSDGVLTTFNEEDDYRGVKAGENDWTDCHVRSFGTLTMSPQNKSGTTATQVRASYSENEVLVDNSKPACVGYFKNENGTKNSAGAWSKVANYMFNMTKQP
ncbi:MAG: hypothetical protein ABIR96_07065 [Bdellovibrionota bacterium]